MKHYRILPILLLSTAIVMPLSHGGWAQDSEKTESNVQEDSNFLERLIQDLLGGEGRTVRVVGLQGLLSSEVSIAQIEISDADGPWLEVNDVVLNWRRAALLRRRLEVDAMTVGTIEVLRKPLPGPEKPPALQADEEAKPFALPELPVAVNVSQLGVGGLILRDPVIGEQILMSINGSASLQDGEGFVDISAVRVDDRKGDFEVSAGFENETSRLYVDVNVLEDPGGIISSLAKIPGEPSLSVSIEGDDVISDFEALIDFRTDDIERLAGAVTIKEVPAEQNQTDPSLEISAQLGGDIAELFLPEYQDFFGSNVSLDVVARQNASTGIFIEQLDISAAALDLSGEIDLAPTFLPRSVELTATVANSLNLPVVLPLSGPPVLVNRADLSIGYNESAGDSFKVELLADGIMKADGLLIDTVNAAIDGALVKDGEISVGSVTAAIDASLVGFSSTDEALWDAAGDDVTVSTDVAWAKNDPVEITDLELVAGNISLSGEATVTGVETGEIALDATLDADVGDLDRFSALTGQDLGGAIETSVTADFDVVSGGFDIGLIGRTTDLTVGPPDADQLLAGETDLALNASRDSGGIAVKDLSIKGQFIDLSGGLALAPNGFPKMVDVSGTVGDRSGNPVILPIPGSETDLQWVALDVFYDEDDGDEFSVEVSAEDINSSLGYALGVAEITSTGTLTSGAGSIVEQVAGQIEAEINGLVTPDPELTKVVSDGVQLTADVQFDSADGALALSGLELNSGDLSLNGAANVANIGKTEAMTVQSDFDLATGDVARFAALIGQPIAGELDAKGKAELDLSSGYFDVTLDGALQDLMLGEPNSDQLLAGKTTLQVAATRDDSGITLQELVLRGDKIDIGGTAKIAPDFFPETIDLAGRVGHPTGGTVLLPLPGAETRLQNIDLDISFDGAARDDFKADITATGLSRTDGFGLETASVTADGTLKRGDGTAIEQISTALAAALSGISTPDPELTKVVSDGVQLTADVQFDSADGALALSGLELNSGDLSLNGAANVANIGKTDAMTVQSDFDLATGDVARFAALIGQPIAGELDAKGKAELDLSSGYFDVTLDGALQDLMLGEPNSDQLLAGKTTLQVAAARDDSGITLQELVLRGDKIDIGGTAKIAPDFFPETIDLAGRVGHPTGGTVLLPLPGAETRLQNIDLDISFDGAARDDFKADITATGLSRTDGFGLETASVTADGTLKRGEGTAIEQISATLAAALSGISTPDPEITKSLSDGFDLTANADYDGIEGSLDLKSLTLGSADLQLSGKATALNIGTEDAIAASAEMELDTGELSRFAALAGTALNGRLVADAKATYDVGTGYFDVDLSGNGQNLAAGIAQVDQLIRGESTIELRAKNDESGLTLETLDLDTAEITANGSGTLSENGGEIKLDTTLQNLGILAPGFNGPLRVDGVITSASDTWALDSKIEGPGGSNAVIAGDIKRPDGTVDLSATGSLPLGLLNGILAPRNLEGTGAFDISVAGAPGLDAVSGTVTVDNSRFSDPASRLALENIAVDVAIANSQVDLNVGGNLSTGGTISATGPINLTEGIPAEIQVSLDNLVLLDPRLYEINLDGDISVNGPLAGGAVIDGRIDIGRSEIKVPTSLGGAASIPDISHEGEGSASLLTRTRAGLVKEEKEEGGGGGIAYPLDILISAPREIYVRGRGLDVELGGEIEIAGSTAALNTTGGLKLIRGRLNILSQRLEFQEADISLQGDLVPDIYMVAVSDSSDIEARIVIEGPITDPEIDLTSDPELPEDEVLSQLFFGKPVQDLSPLELAQLAAAVNELTGGSGGLFGKIRDGIGVDDLDVSTDEDGNTDVTAGKYLSDRVYTDVTVGSDGNSEIQLNYEVTKDLKVRGGFDNEGNTGIGLTFEFDY